jgi:hypothetical protein
VQQLSWLSKQLSAGARPWQGALLALLIAVGIARIASTYPVFSQTWDEPAHLAAGMEWLDRGTYRYEPLHPPLARVLVALGPYWDGVRSARYANVWIEGNALLHTRGAYDRNLALARLGVLPFFMLAAVVVFLWSRRLFGPGAALAATALFTTLPPVLAHAGIATTDLAVAATFALATYAATRWLERPTLLRGVGLGTAIGLTLLSKLSALLFLPAAMAAIVVTAFATRTRGHGTPRSMENAPSGARMWAVRAVYLSVLVTIWAGYRFSVGPLVSDASSAADGGTARITATTPSVPPPSSAADRIIDAVGHAAVYPAPALFRGVGELIAKNRAGHKSYLLGEVRTTGWWYFFPVALAVKTPIPFLLLAAVGIAAALHGATGEDRRRRLMPIAIAAAVLLVCLPSRINIGVRHILPIYPFLAILAGYGVVALWRKRGPGGVMSGPLAAVALLSWQGVASIRAHPDYLAYFNELAGPHPERILVDSDLDDGQDLKRLADTLRARHITEIALAYAGSATVRAHGLPPVRWLEPHQPTTGWIAVSLYALKLGSLDRPGHDDFAWLEGYRPVATVGKSILLYYIPAMPDRSRRTAKTSASANATIAKRNVES